MAGWKQWAIGEIVEAGDIQGFIQNQTVMVFDTDTARDTALSGVVIEGMMAYTKDSDSVKVYDGAAWIALAEAPDLTTLIPKSTVTTAGDLIVADGASSVTRIGVGTDGQILTLASGAPTWADAAGGGAGDWALITSTATGTTAIKTITGLGGYKDYYIQLQGVTTSSSSSLLRILSFSAAEQTTNTFINNKNSNSANGYGSTTYEKYVTLGSFDTAGALLYSGTFLWGADSTGYAFVESLGGSTGINSDDNQYAVSGFATKQNAAFNRFSIQCVSGQMNGGTIAVYGRV